MKQLISVFLVCALVMIIAGNSHAALGWAGNTWPVHGNSVTDNNPVGVFVQGWKGGVTDAAGQGAGISATLFYGPNGGPYTSVAMAYNGDIGSNDEYTAEIPMLALTGPDIWFFCELFDSTDSSTYIGAMDQNNNAPPFQLFITPVLNQDVLVTFFLCMPPLGHPDYMAAPGDVCITGDHAEITNWGTGVANSQACVAASPQFYTVSVLFAAGSNPTVNYKYRRNGCVDWESGANHQITINDANPSYMVPVVDHWSSYVGGDCAGCTVGVESSTWGQIKAIYQ